MQKKNDFYKWCSRLLPHMNGVLLKKYNADTENIEYIPFQYHTDKEDLVISYMIEFELDMALSILYKNGKNKSIRDSYNLYQAIIYFGKKDYKRAALYLDEHIQGVKNKSLISNEILEFQQYIMRLMNI